MLFRKKLLFLISYFTIIYYLLFIISPKFSNAEIFDRVVAFVDDHAITLSEFKDQYERTVRASPDITEEEVLNTMINRILLLREARRYRIEAPADEEVLKEYIDLKLRAYIRIEENKVEEFYQNNKDKFHGVNLDDVRDEIEKYLTEKELNERLKEAIRELKKNAYIKVQLR